MQQYEMITDSDLINMTKEHLASMYNDAVEMIWHLERRMNDLQEENEAVWESYDELCNRMFS